MTFEQRDAAAAAGGLFVLAAMGFSAVTVSWQTLHWLKHGVWEAWPLHRAFRHLGVLIPSSEWKGVNIVWDYILGCPISVVVPAVLFLIGMALASIAAADS